MKPWPPGSAQVPNPLRIDPAACTSHLHGKARIDRLRRDIINLRADICIKEDRIRIMIEEMMMEQEKVNEEERVRRERMEKIGVTQTCKT
jgi:hypothetical protein